MTRASSGRFGALARKAPDAPPLENELALRGMRIGLFGGSFNPVHEGHLHAASEAMRRLNLDRVWWLVTPQNPLKSAEETADHARRMADVRALASRPGFVVSDIEDRLGARYTAETIRALQRRHPGVRFVWIMGADNLGGFHHWRGWADIMARVPVAVIARPGGSVRARLSPAARRFAAARLDPREAAALPDLPPPAWTYLNAPLNPASSTELRRRHGGSEGRAAPAAARDGEKDRSMLGFFRRMAHRKGRSTD